MENTSLIALSRATALERKMALVANNIANMNTTGYKAESPLFTEYLVDPEEARTANDLYSMVLDQGTVRNVAMGPILQTGNPLDIALEGDGYLQVETLDGLRYTRSGSLSMDSNRILINSAGLPVLDDTGNQITIPANIQNIMVSADGSISTENGQLAKLGLYRFDREQDMQVLGSGLLVTDERPKTAETTQVRQGFLEQSNVEAVREMTSMIEISRQYQSIQKMMEKQHDLLRNAYSKLAKISA